MFFWYQKASCHVYFSTDSIRMLPNIRSKQQQKQQQQQQQQQHANDLFTFVVPDSDYLDDLVRNCHNSHTLAMVLMQPCVKPSTYS